jgi:hypothetical protein
MNKRGVGLAVLVVLTVCNLLWVVAQENSQHPSRDAVIDAQQPQGTQSKRPEQKKNSHDSSAIFAAPNAKPSFPCSRGKVRKGRTRDSISIVIL